MGVEQLVEQNNAESLKIEMSDLLNSMKLKEKETEAEVKEKEITPEFVSNNITFNNKKLTPAEVIKVSTDTFKFSIKLDGISKDIDVFFTVAYDQQKKDMFIKKVELKATDVNGDYVLLPKEFNVSGVSNVLILPELNQRKVDIVLVPKSSNEKLSISDVDNIESKSLSEIFHKSTDKDYLDHLALSRDKVKQEDGKYRVPFVVLKDLTGKNSSGTYLEQKVDEQSYLEFDASGKLISKSVKMPNLFGSVREFNVEDGVLIEKQEAKEAREKKEAEHNKRLETLLSNAGGHIKPNTSIVSKIDIDGCYSVEFTSSGVVLESGVVIPELPKQSFRVKFDDNGTISFVTEPNDKFYVNDERSTTERVLAKDKYSIFTIQLVEDSKDSNKDKLKFLISETKEAPVYQEKYLINGLPKSISPYYNMEKGSNKLDLIDAKSGDKSHKLISGLELNGNGEKLKDPDSINVYPLGGDINGIEISPSMLEFRKKYNDLLSSLTDKDGAYKLESYQIDSVIYEYNKPLKEKVYKIFNPSTKEYEYYTANKKDNKISFIKDEKIESYIASQKEALDSRFKTIEEIYKKEKKAQEKVVKTKFEKLSTGGAYNFGLMENELSIQRNQKETILDEKYDPSKINYEVNVWMSKETALETSPTRTDGSLPNGYDSKGLLYFDASGVYDEEKNKDYYDKNRITIEDYTGTLMKGKSAIEFYQDSK